MTIGIITGFSKKHSAGLEEFLLGLLAGLASVRTEGIDYVLYTSKESDLSGALKDRGIEGFRIVPIGFGKWWKYIGLLFAPRSDVYLWNGPTVSPLFFPRRSAVLVYDFAYRHYGARSLQNRFMDILSKFAFRRAKKVIAISQATADDVVHFFGISPKKIVVVYPGVKDLSNIIEEKVSTPPSGYFLFVGTLKERKNVLNLIRGFACIKGKVLQDLVIAGHTDFTSPYGKRIVEEIRKADIGTRVHFLGPVNENKLKYLYRHAIVFAFPSAFEGFGMPVIEAMGEGTAVLTSNVSSLPEAAGTAALLVDPFNSDAISEGLLRLARDPTLRMELIEKGKVRATAFSWLGSARAFLAILSRL